MSPEAYREHVGATFAVHGVDEAVPLRLVEVSEPRVASGFRQFSLYFHGPPSAVLPQGIYTLAHPALGPLALFIVPILGSNHERIVYEACFNQRVSAAGTPESVRGGA
jgi:hypothetical protein